MVYATFAFANTQQKTVITQSIKALHKSLYRSCCCLRLAHWLLIITHRSSTKMATESFYNFEVKDLKGNPFKLTEETKGKIVLVVNVASKYGLWQASLDMCS